MKENKDQLKKEMRISGMTCDEISEKYGISSRSIERATNTNYYPNDLHAIRVSRNLTATEVAAMFGKSKAWMTKVEHGMSRLSKETYDKFLEIYHVDKIDGVRIKNNHDDDTIESLKKENKMLRELLSFYVNKES